MSHIEYGPGPDEQRSHNDDKNLEQSAQSIWSKRVGGKKDIAVLPDGSWYMHQESIRIVTEDGQEKIGKMQFNEWQDKGFNLLERINKLDGPFVEIAGPTPHGYEQIDLTVVGNKLQVSNIQSESGVDFQADARQMPLRDESVGAVFCSCFGHPSRRVGEEHLDNRVLYQKNMFEVYKEAVRILRPGGLIVVQGRLAEDLAMEKSFGFKLRQYSEFYDELTDPFRKRFDIVMEKVALPPAGERK